jgi:uncharacterized protein YndB with AHSA1/START domain
MTPNPNVSFFLNLSRTFAAPREQVFRAWTEADAIERWFKPMGLPSRVKLLDLRVGGGYRIETIDADGITHSISGVYREIARPQRLVFTWLSDETDREETLVTLEFVERDGATEIVLWHERFASETMKAMHVYGWNAMFETLTGYL